MHQHREISVRNYRCCQLQRVGLKPVLVEHTAIILRGMVLRWSKGPAVKIIIAHYLSITYTISVYTAAQPITGSQYGYSRAAIAPYDVTCNGSERRLEDCGRSIAFSSFCDPTTNSAGVVCTYNACKSSQDRKSFGTHTHTEVLLYPSHLKSSFLHTSSNDCNSHAYSIDLYGV